MKRNTVLAITLIVIFLQGCIVKSLHPFYGKKDVIFRKELLSTWKDQDGARWEIRPFKDQPAAYELHWSKSDTDDIVFLAHLFSLDGQLYFDFLPLSDNNKNSMAIFDLHIMPTHSIAKVEILTDNEVQIRWFNEQWLKSLFDENRIKISHEVIDDELPKNEEDKTYVLTASTEELQKFIIKYGKDPKAFGGDDNDDKVWLRLTKN
jgi:hypothetical protein